MRAVEIDEKSDRGEAVTQNDFFDVTFVDKGEELERVIPEEEEEVPVPENTNDSEPPLDESWVKVYERGSEA